MTLPGDPNLPPGVTTRDTDGGPSCDIICPKCGSQEVSDLHAPDLWCSECDYEWDVRKPEEDNELDSIDLNDWTYKHARAVYDATQYLSDGEAQRRIRMMAWREAPDSLKVLM